MWSKFLPAADPTTAAVEWTKVWDAGAAGEPVSKDAASADGILPIGGFLFAVPDLEQEVSEH